MSFTDDWWWIDYIEKQMDPSTEQDLRDLIAASEEDRAAYERFVQLRQWLLGSDPIEGWVIESRLRKVRRNVMKAIDELPAHGKVQLRSQKDATNSLRA